MGAQADLASGIVVCIIFLLSGLFLRAMSSSEPPLKGSAGRFVASSMTEFMEDIPSLDGFDLPKVAVFDLDATCWNHYGLDHKESKNKLAFSPPFRWVAETRQVCDSAGKEVKIFPDLPKVLLALHQAGVAI